MKDVANPLTFLTNVEVSNQKFDKIEKEIPITIHNSNNNDRKSFKKELTRLKTALPEIVSKKEPIKKKAENVLKFENREFEQRRIRKSNYDKIMFHPPTPDYYTKFPIQPGVGFIQKIFEHDYADKAIKNLKINIPETYWNNMAIFYVYNDADNNDELTMVKNKRDFQLFAKLKEVEKNYYKRDFTSKENLMPFFVIRSPISTSENDWEAIANVERFETSQENSTKDIGNGIIQRFIRSKGKNRDLLKDTVFKESIPVFREEKEKKVTKEETESNIIRNSSISPPTKKLSEINLKNKSNIELPKEQPKVFKKFESYSKTSIVRIEYKTRYNDSKNPNIAYYLMNKHYLEPELTQDKTKYTIDKYNKICTLDTRNPSSFEIFTMAGDSLKPYEFYCNQIVKFIHKWFKFLLKTIVCDFIRDERGIVYFLGLKAFTPLYEGDKLGLQLTNKDYINNENNINKIYKTLPCRMCMLSYPKSKITKVVTFKLIMNLRENLEKRHYGILDHINGVNTSDSESCRVCDLCYKLLITDQELCEIQKTMAISMNIMNNSNDKTDSNVKSLKENKPKITNELGKNDKQNKVKHRIEKLTQYRILFYFIRLYNLELEKIQFDANTEYKFCIKVFDQKFSIPIFEDMKQIVSKDEVDLNFAKMFYFFSSDINSLKSLLKNEVVDFRIIRNDDWNNPVSQCQTQCFFFFESEPSTFRIKNIFNFFSDEMSFFKCQTYVGLTKDGEVSTSKMNLYNYRMKNNIYLTDPDYFSYHALPDDWYELFVPEDNTFKEEKMPDIEGLVNGIISNLGFSDWKTTKEDEKDIYDPYNELILMQNKKSSISKIKSIAMIQDKDPWEKKVEGKRIRPLTSKLMKTFNFDKKEKGNTITSNNSKENDSRSVNNSMSDDQDEDQLSNTTKSIKDSKLFYLVNMNEIDNLLSTMDRKANNLIDDDD